MKHFANMVSALEMSNKTSVKSQALIDYFSVAPDSDKLWMIRLFTGKRPRRPVPTKLMRQWCMEVTGLPEWLFAESYSAVGDLGETISLVLPAPEIAQRIDKSLTAWMQELIELSTKDEAQKKAYVLRAWSGLTQQERFVFNKLIGGSFRIGVSKKGLVNALAKFSGQHPDKLMHALIGDWSMDEMTFDRLINGEHINYDASKPYPFCLAHALDKPTKALGAPSDWQAEYKWDGIRGQLIKRDGEVFIWSRGEELVTSQFPELVEAINRAINHAENADKTHKAPHLSVPDFVLDGEILPIKAGRILNFSALQRRINRKNVSKKLRDDVPIHFYAYDCLERDDIDLREQPLSERNLALDDVLQHLAFAHESVSDEHATLKGAENKCNRIKRSRIIPFTNWQTLADLRESAREVQSEGIMLKSLNSVYHAGRKKGDWWKWKVDPLTIDAVLIYAQRGSGRRSGHYTDYTFAIRTGQVNAKGEPKLVPVAKAYSGLTQAEIVEVSRFVRNNSIEKFGPVRTVKPELVFEIAFEGIAESKRHKSGVALRFPRIARWRRDKTLEDIDTVERVKALINAT